MTSLSSTITSETEHRTRLGELIAAGRLDGARRVAELIYAQTAAVSDKRRLDWIEGRLQAVDLRWLPELPGGPEAPPPCPSNRIIHLFKVIYPFESTGGAIRNLNTVKYQKEIGLDPYVITPINYPRNVGLGEFPLEHEVAGVRCHHFDYGPASSVRFNSQSDLIALDTMAAASVIRKHGGALIHAASGYHGFDAALKGLALRRHFSIPMIYEVRSFHEHTWTREHYAAEVSPYTALRKGQEERCMREADFVVTISESSRTVLSERGVPAEKITVIPNAIDEAFFSERNIEASFRDRFAKPGQKIVGYISNISYREGHSILLRGIERLRARGCDVVGLIVGDGPLRNELEELAVELGIGNYVHFVGSIDHAEIPAYYAITDIFVVPRRRDYAADFVTPLKPYEAMAMRIPLVVSDRPALQEIVAGGKRGKVFRTEEPDDLARVVEELIRHPEDARRIADAAYTWVTTERTWRQNARRYKDLYEAAIGAEVGRGAPLHCEVPGEISETKSPSPTALAKTAGSTNVARLNLADVLRLYGDLGERSEAFWHSERDGRLSELFYKGHREYIDRLMAATNPPNVVWDHPRDLEVKGGAQSKSFMVDLIPLIHEFLGTQPRGALLTLLDVGCASGHGTNLLASLYQSSRSLGYRLRVTGLDIRDDYRSHVRLFCPYISHVVNDIYLFEQTFDMVISSHTIEHVPNPGQFCRRLQELAKHRVFIVAPFDEPEEGRTIGHINSFDDSFIASLNPIRVLKMENPAWGYFLNPRYKMFIAELPGVAT